MNKFIDDNLKKGFICKSTSPQASPFFFVSKKDSQALRPCQDYRYLNESTIKNVYPLPSIDDSLHKLHGAKIFMKLHIWWGYNNVWIKEGDEWKGVFITKRGLFELTSDSNVLWNDQFCYRPFFLMIQIPTDTYIFLRCSLDNTGQF